MDAVVFVYLLFSAAPAVADPITDPIVDCFGTATPAFSYQKYMPAPTQVEGVTLPRNYFQLYRGLTDGSDQFNYSKAISAILGDTTPSIGAKVQSFVSEELATGHSDRLDRNILARDGLLESLETAKKCISNHEDKWTAANLLASELVNQHFAKTEALGKVPNRYLNYDDEFRYYGDYSDYVIYTTLHPKLANWYGRRVLFFRDIDKKGADINFWNYKNSGKFANHNMDVTEYLVPNFINASGIDGMYTMIEEGGNGGDNWNKCHNKRRMNYGLYKTTLSNGDPIALIFSGEKVPCAIPDPTQPHKIFECSDDFEIASGCPGSQYQVSASSQAVFKQPTPTSNALPVIGVILRCKVGTECTIPEEIKSWELSQSGRAVPSEIANEVKDMTISLNGTQYKAVIHTF